MRYILKLSSILGLIIFLCVFFSCIPVEKESVTHENSSFESQVSEINISQGKGSGMINTWKYPRPFVIEYQRNGSIIKSVSQPYIEYRYSNVSHSDATWFACFKVDEYTESGQEITYGKNVFEYRNLKIVFAGGNKTIFIRSLWNGKMHELKNWSRIELGDNFGIQIIEKKGINLFVGNEFQEALNKLNALEVTEKTETLGMLLCDFKTVVLGGYLEDYVFKTNTDNNGDYFNFEIIVQYEDGYGIENTTGVLLVSFDVYNTHTGEIIPVVQGIQLDYLAKE